MENQNKINTTSDGLIPVSDLILSTLIQTVSQSSFQGLNRSGNKVYFLFENTSKVIDIIKSYQAGSEFTFAPLVFSENLRKSKAMIFGDYGI